MALGKTYRINVLNSTGQTVPTNKVTVTAMPWNFSSTGVQTWGSAINIVAPSDGSSASSGLTTTSYGASATVNNSTNAYLGATLFMQVDWTSAGVTPAGAFTFFLQRSHDGGTTWPDNGNGTVVGVLNCTAQTLYKTAVEF